MQYKYAEINETGVCFAQSYLSGVVSSQNMIPIEDSVNVIGMLWDGDKWTAIPTEESDVTIISRRQGLITLLVEENIKEDYINDVISEISDPIQQSIAKIEFANQYWDINNPLISSFGAALNITPERMQQLFNIAITV